MSPAALALVLAAAAAREAEPGTDANIDGLHVRAVGSRCLDAASIAERIVQEYPAASSSHIDVTVTERGPGGIEVELAAGAARAQRTLRFGDEPCATQAATVALSAALAIEFFVASHDTVGVAAEPTTGGATPPPATVTSPAGVTSPARATPPPAPMAEPRTPGWSLAAGIVVHSGVVTAPSVGASVRPAHAWRRLILRVGVQWSYADRIVLGDGVARLHELVAVPEACARVVVARAVLAGCGGARVGAVVARGRGFARPRSEASPYLAPSAALELVAPLSRRFALAVGAHVATPVVRPRLVAGTDSRLAARVSGGGGVDLVVRLP